MADTARDLRSRFDFVASLANVGVWSCDVPFGELIWNDACKAHFGLPSDAQVTIDTFYEQMHEDDVTRTRAAIDHALRTAQPYDVEYRTRQQDGSYRWIRAVGRTDYRPDGTPFRFEGVTVDITATRQAHDRFRELADAMPQIVWSADAQGRVDYVNRRWFELTHQRPESVDVGGPMHPDDEPAVTAAFAHALQSGEPFQHEFRLRLPGAAEPRWFLGRALPARDDRGRITRWYGTSTDIHDRKRTEDALMDSRDRLRAALDASSTGTFRWDMESNALDWDENLDRLFGLSPGQTARSLDQFVTLVHPEDRARVLDACARCATQNADFAEEFRVTWPDGTVRWLYDKGRVFTDGRGRRYMNGACVDVTERRNQEDALRAADRHKDEFLGMLAHEIRNPLAPIMYSASVLERHVADHPALQRPLEVINRQARRMVRIVDDLLDISRVTQGKILLQRERVAIATLLGQCVEATRPLFESRRHTVHTRLDREADTVIVLGDTVRLAQIFENLLINAAKYTPDGGHIEVGLDTAGGEVHVVVADNGIGIAPEMLDRVFDLFAQANTALDRSQGGLGIGLTLVDRLSRLHGGSARADSEGLGLGSRFTVTLPQVLTHADAPAPRAGGAASAARTVLIVDDNVDAAEILQMLLEISGHTVHLAHDGHAAIARARAHRPDVILMDLGLPGLDGYQAVRELRRAGELTDTVIVATTGYGRAEDRERCREAGFDAHLTKPIETGELERLLALERKHL